MLRTWTSVSAYVCSGIARRWSMGSSKNIYTDSNKMWALVSEEDTRTFNGMNSCMANLVSAGTKISRLNRMAG